MCARWAKDNLGRLRRADPSVPSHLDNRAADNWRPLLAIADAAAGEWPERARAIAAQTVDGEQARRVGLLADIRDIFDGNGVDRIRSAELATSLVAVEGHPWAEFGKVGKPLTANALARLLAGDRIIPKTVRFGVGPDDTAKGYERAQFEDAFARYLPAGPDESVTTSQPQDLCGSPANWQSSQGMGCDGSENPENPGIAATCDDVTVRQREEAPNSARIRVRL
jgi:hypothetical protein